MQIDIHTHDKQLLSDLFGRTRINSGDKLPLAEGVTLEYQGTVKYYSVDWPDIVTFVLEYGTAVSAGVVATRLTDWIREKVGSRVERIEVDREEIELDKEGRIRRIIREKITRSRE